MEFPAAQLLHHLQGHDLAGSDGLAAAQEIQERFEVPAMAATGHLTAAEAEVQRGLLGILSKP